MSKFSKGEAIRFGWNTMKANFVFFLKISLVVGIIFFLPQIFNPKGGPGFPPWPVLLTSLLIGLAFYILRTIIQLGLLKISLNAVDNKPLVFRDLFSQTKLSLLLRYVGSSILYFLIFAGGLILLIIPGVIWAIKYGYYSYFILEGSKIRESLKQSARITEGAKWDLLIFSILLVLINLAGLLALIVGLFATVPTTFLATAFVFRRLQSLASTPDLQEASPVKAAVP